VSPRSADTDDGQDDPLATTGDADGYADVEHGLLAPGVVECRCDQFEHP
jgi:hypothetical protein